MIASRCYVSVCRGNDGALNGRITYRWLWLSLLTGRGRPIASAAGLYFLRHIGSALGLSRLGETVESEVTFCRARWRRRRAAIWGEANKDRDVHDLLACEALTQGDTVTSFVGIGAAPRKQSKTASTTIPSSSWRSRRRIGHALASTTNVARGRWGAATGLM